MDQAFPLRFCILQAIKNWMAGMPGNEGRHYSVDWTTGLDYWTHEDGNEQEYTEIRQRHTGKTWSFMIYHRSQAFSAVLNIQFNHGAGASARFCFCK